MENLSPGVARGERERPGLYLCPLFGRQPATKDQELWGYNWSPCLSWEKLGPEPPTGSVRVFAASVSHSAFLPAQACSLDHLQFSSRTLANRLWHTHLHPRFYFLGRLICDSLLECMLKMKKQKHKRLKCQNIEKTEKETNHTLPHCFSRVALGFYTRMSGNNTYFKKNVINHRILLFSETK